MSSSPAGTRFTFVRHVVTVGLGLGWTILFFLIAFLIKVLAGKPFEPEGSQTFGFEWFFIVTALGYFAQTLAEKIAHVYSVNHHRKRGSDEDKKSAEVIEYCLYQAGLCMAGIICAGLWFTKSYWEVLQLNLISNFKFGSADYIPSISFLSVCIVIILTGVLKSKDHPFYQSNSGTTIPFTE